MSNPPYMGNSTPAAYQFPSVPPTVPNIISRNVPSYISSTEGSSTAPSYVTGNRNAPLVRPSYPTPQVPSMTPAYASTSNYSYLKRPTTPIPSPNQNQNQNQNSNPGALSKPEVPHYMNSLQSEVPYYTSGLQFIPSTPPPRAPNNSHATTSSNKPLYATFNSEPHQNYNNQQYAGYQVPMEVPKPVEALSISLEASYTSNLSKMYQASPQTSYLSLKKQEPIPAAPESMRLSAETEIQAKVNEDGSTEGWLWQQRVTGKWDRLYFILDKTILLGFMQYPQEGEEAAPIQGLPLTPGMVVTPTFSVSYIGVRGFCFAIQVTPKSEELVVFDTVSSLDRRIWVKALQEATKENEVSAWMPWEIQGKAESLQKQEEKKQNQKDEEDKKRRHEEEMVRCKLEELKRNEIAKLDASLASQLSYEHENTKNIQNMEEAASRLRQEASDLEKYKLQVSQTPSSQCNESVQELESHIQDRRAQLNLIEQQRALKMMEQEKMLQAEEIRNIKEQQEAFLKEAEKRIREDLAASFELERETFRAKQEEELRMEKEKMKEAMADKKAQVLQWLVDNPSWKAYYKELGVTDEEFADPRIVRDLIKKTADFVISSDLPASPPPIKSPISLVENKKKKEKQEGKEKKKKKKKRRKSKEEGKEEDKEIGEGFDMILPPRKAPPPPPDDEDAPPIIRPPPPAPVRKEVPALPEKVPELPKKVVDLPEEVSSHHKISSQEEEEVVPPQTSIPPPPSHGPPPPPPIIVTKPKKLKIMQSSKPVEAVEPRDEMFNQIHSFQFAPKPLQVEKVEPLDTRNPVLGEIENFQFNKERKSVPTIKELPKQNQDSLTAILSSQLSLFRSKLREDVDDDDDDDWD